MARIWLACLSCVMAAAVSASPAAAFKLGGWQGDANHDESGKFSDCTMTAGFRSGITLAFVITRDFKWGLALADDHWKLPVGKTETVTLTIDSHAPITATAKIIDVHGLLVPLDNSDAMVDALRSGRKLTVKTKSGSFVFQLSGTKQAIALLAACVAENLENEQEDHPSPDGQDALNGAPLPSSAMVHQAALPNLR